MAYLLKLAKRHLTDGRIWKTKAKAMAHKRAIIRNNSYQQRKQTGFVNMRVVKYKPYKREKMELRKVKDFIWS